MPLSISFRHKTQGLCGSDTLILNPLHQKTGIRTHNWLTALILKLFGKIFDLQIVDDKGKKHTFHLNKADLRDWIKRNQGNTTAIKQGFEASIAAICKLAIANAVKEESEINPDETTKEEHSTEAKAEETDHSEEPPQVKVDTTLTSEAAEQNEQPLDSTSTTNSASAPNPKTEPQTKKEGLQRFKSVAERVISKVHNSRGIVKAAMFKTIKKQAIAYVAKARADEEKWLKDKAELVKLYTSHIKPLLPKARQLCYQALTPPAVT
jgi:hypothetical protein